VNILKQTAISEEKKNLTGTMFIKDDKAVLLYADKISFREYDPAHDDTEFSEYASFQGTNILNTIDFIYLFHITSIVPLKHFIKDVKKSNLTHLHSQPQTNLIQIAKSVLQLPVIIIAACVLFFTSCSTERQVQMQKGNLIISNGHMYFEKTNDWQQIPFDTVINGVRVKNISVKKSK
jgi:hypothetical protein